MKTYFRARRRSSRADSTPAEKIVAEILKKRLRPGQRLCLEKIGNVTLEEAIREILMNPLKESERKQIELLLSSKNGSRTWRHNERAVTKILHRLQDPLIKHFLSLFLVSRQLTEKERIKELAKYVKSAS